MRGGGLLLYVSYLLCFSMLRRPPRSTRTDTLFPYTTLFRSFEIVGFLVGGAAEHLDDPAAQRLQILARIADDERADRGAADDEHFVRQRFEHRRQIAAGQRKTPEHQQDQYDDADKGKHAGSTPIEAGGPGKQIGRAHV